MWKRRIKAYFSPVFTCQTSTSSLNKYRKDFGFNIVARTDHHHAMCGEILAPVRRLYVENISKNLNIF